MDKFGYKPVWVCTEDIMYLKSGIDFIIKNAELNNEHFEVFTMQNIVKQYETGLTDEFIIKVIASAESDRIAGMSEEEIDTELRMQGIDPGDSADQIRAMIQNKIMESRGSR